MDSLDLLITAGGLDALVDAQNGDTDAIRVVEIGLTETAFDMAPTIDALPGEFKRLATLAGQSVSATVIHMTATDSGTDVYDLRGIGLYLEDGTLFAVYAQPDPIFRKVNIAAFLLAFDVAFQNNIAGSIEFGDVSFLYPPASETVKGVAYLATQAEVDEGQDDSRIVTPSKLKSLIAGIVDALQAAIDALTGRSITGAGLATGGGDLGANRQITVPAASVAEVNAGALATKAVTPASLTGILADIAARAMKATTVTGSGLATGGGDIGANRVIDVAAASDAETIAGEIANKATTPASVAALLASRDIATEGLLTGGGDLSSDRNLEVLAASPAEARAGTAADRALTPASLGPIVKSLGDFGYITIPSADPQHTAMIQWGRFTSIANGTVTIAFPVAFSAPVFAVINDGTSDTTTADDENFPAVRRNSFTATSFQAFSQNDTADECCYIAIGEVDLS